MLIGSHIDTLLAQAALSLIPVLLFLSGLALVDTYKLLTLRRVLQTLLAGCVAGLVCYALNSAVLAFLKISYVDWMRTGAPVIEEIAKAAYLIWLIRAHRVAFLVDSAVCGFAVGAGFAVVENLTYIPEISGAGLAVAAVRGLGTAMMHGGTTAIFAVISTNLAETRRSSGARVFLPGLAVAIAIHLLHNQPLLPRVTVAALILVTLPAIMVLIMWRSEVATRAWIGTKLEKDLDLLAMMSTRTFSSSPAGVYLQSLQATFEPVILGDLLSYLQLSLELSARAKGDLMRREMGFPVDHDPELDSQIHELKYLEKQIGFAGKLALSPLLGNSARDIWEMQQLAAA